MAKLSEMSRDEASALLYDSYMKAHESVSSGASKGPHPSKDLSRWREMGGPEEGQDGENAGLGPVLNQRPGKSPGGLGVEFNQNKAKDDVQPLTSGGLPNRSPAKDGHGSFLVNDTKPPMGPSDGGRAMMSLVPGYRRLP